MWSVANEPESNQNSSRDYFQQGSTRNTPIVNQINRQILDVFLGVFVAFFPICKVLLSVNCRQAVKYIMNVYVNVASFGLNYYG